MGSCGVCMWPGVGGMVAEPGAPPSLPGPRRVWVRSGWGWLGDPRVLGQGGVADVHPVRRGAFGREVARLPAVEAQGRAGRGTCSGPRGGRRGSAVALPPAIPGYVAVLPAVVAYGPAVNCLCGQLAVAVTAHRGSLARRWARVDGGWTVRVVWWCPCWSPGRGPGWPGPAALAGGDRESRPTWFARWVNPKGLVGPRSLVSGVSGFT